jgi:hypothetical protein
MGKRRPQLDAGELLEVSARLAQLEAAKSGLADGELAVDEVV